MLYGMTCNRSNNGLDPLSRWTRNMDELFAGALGTGGFAGVRVDIREDGEDIVIEAEVPGLTRDDIEISVENGVLTISGQYKAPEESEKSCYHLRERVAGRFSRSFRLPPTSDLDRVEAGLQNGVLTLTIPTREEAKPRKIPVK